MGNHPADGGRVDETQAAPPTESGPTPLAYGAALQPLGGKIDCIERLFDSLHPFRVFFQAARMIPVSSIPNTCIVIPDVVAAESCVRALILKK